MRTRIAPTPSGYLHAGNALNFLLTRKLAHSAGGSVLLRIDDLDSERARPEYIVDIFDSLAWLGIEWNDGPRDVRDLGIRWSQHHRTARYEELLRTLRNEGHVYACTCSRQRSAVCDCRDRSLPFNAPDTAWRLRLQANGPVTIHEATGATHAIDLSSVMRDPVLRQRNGRPAYQIASLADDVDFGIDLIVRGADLLPSTACQLLLAELLGLTAFTRTRFIHHPLITALDGTKLSKSDGASSLKAMREAGIAPDALHAQADALFDHLRDQGL